MSSLVERPANIFIQSFKAVNKLMEDLIPNRKITVVSVNNDFHLRAIKRKNKKVVYPYIAVQPQTNAVDYSRQPPHNSQRVGYYGGVDRMKHTRAHYRLLPIMCTFHIYFVTDTASDLYEFIQSWLYASVTNQFKFELLCDGLTIPVDVLPNQDLSMPDLRDDDQGEQFVLETEFDMKTYTGMVRDIPLIRTIRGNYNFTRKPAPPPNPYNDLNIDNIDAFSNLVDVPDNPNFFEITRNLSDL